MSKPEVRVNSFFKNRSYCVDPVSKFFIIMKMILGLNYLALLGNVKRIIIKLGYAYSAVLLVSFIYITFDNRSSFLIPLATYNCYYGFTLVIGILSRKRLRQYFTQLSLFDVEVDCEINAPRTSVYNLVQCIFSLLCCLSSAITEQIIDGFNWLDAYYLPMRILNIVQFYFSAHLLSPLVIRMQLINYLFQNSFPNVETIRSLDKAVKFNSKKIVELTTLIEYFNLIIKAYDTLNQAIKWQLLSIFIKVFLIAIIDLYHITWQLLQKELNFNDIIVLVDILTVHLIPMLSVCMIGDALKKEVIWLRETLGCRIYEGRLEQQHRRAAQALLTLTEARGLSFSLFHMFNIDMSLPFKMFNLLITNIIIMLQFQKIKSNTPT